MIYYLRTKTGKNIFETEIYKEIYKETGKNYVELHSSVYIENYSLFLLNIEDSIKRLEFIKTIDMLSELRGWLWEVYFMTKKNTGESYDDVLKEVRKTLKKVAKKYELNIVED
jgi:hypothetical protein